MQADDMAEIADIITSVLGAVTPTAIVDAEGRPAVSKARFSLAEDLADAARKRAADLLAQHPLYPELVLDTAHLR